MKYLIKYDSASLFSVWLQNLCLLAKYHAFLTVPDDFRRSLMFTLASCVHKRHETLGQEAS